MTNINRHHSSDYNVINRIITTYGNMIQEKIDESWDEYLLTLLFTEIRGPRSAVLSAMNWNAHVAYGKALTRIVRNPKSPSKAGMLPIWTSRWQRARRSGFRMSPLMMVSMWAGLL